MYCTNKPMQMNEPQESKQITDASKTKDFSILLNTAESENEKGKSESLRTECAGSRSNSVQNNHIPTLQVPGLWAHPAVFAGMSDTSFLQRQAALARAAQLQVAALALSCNVRATVLAAQLHHGSAQIQDQESPITAGGEAFHQQLIDLAALTGGLENQFARPAASIPSLTSQLTSSALAACQQIQDAQMPPGQTNQDANLHRAGLLRAVATKILTPSVKETTREMERPPGPAVTPCRARSMPMDHNFKVSYVVYL